MTSVPVHGEEEATRVPFVTSVSSPPPRMGRYFTGLSAAVFLGSTGAGMVNYLQNPHVDLVSGESADRSSLATGVAVASLVFAAVLSMLMFGRNHFKFAGRVSGLFALTALPLYLGFETILSGRENTTKIIDLAVVVICLCALWTIPPDAIKLSTLGILCVLAVVYSLLLVAVRPSNAYFVDVSGNLGTSTKALIGHDQLAGLFGHSNTLGIFSAVTIPLVSAIESRRLRYVCMSLAMFALVWSASRTSILALAVGAGVAALSARSVRMKRGSVPATLLTAVALVGIILPFTVSDPSEFTRRGAIWMGSLQAWSASPITGQGDYWFDDQAQVFSDLGNQASSGHNIAATWLVIGGLIAAALGLWMLGFMIRAAVLIAIGSRSIQPVWYAAVVFVVSWLEFVFTYRPGSELFFPVIFAFAVIVRKSESYQKWSANGSSWAAGGDS